MIYDFNNLGGLDICSKAVEPTHKPTIKDSSDSTQYSDVLLVFILFWVAVSILLWISLVFP